eukprot:SAG11_NODE_64_length_18817_cov_64.238327_11_plen_242_part_00
MSPSIPRTFKTPSLLCHRLVDAEEASASYDYPSEVCGGEATSHADATSSCADVVCDSDGDGTDDFPCFCGHDDCATYCCCERERGGDEPEMEAAPAPPQSCTTSFFDTSHNCYEDFTNICNEPTLKALWETRGTRMPHQIVQGLCDVFACVCQIPVVVGALMLDETPRSKLMILAFVIGLALPSIEYLMTIGVDHTALRLDQSFILPWGSEKALELNYLLLRSQVQLPSPTFVLPPLPSCH